MIVTCPSCDAKYRAEPEALARRSGRVRCAGCGHYRRILCAACDLGPDDEITVAAGQTGNTRWAAE